MAGRLEKFGKIEIFKKDGFDYEFKITEGFSTNAENTFDLLKICKEIAQDYPYIKKWKTDDNLFHLVLTKLSKNKS